MEETGKRETELNNKTEKSNEVCCSMTTSLTNKKGVPKETKMKVHKAMCSPTLHGCPRILLVGIAGARKSRISALEIIEIMIELGKN